jgi:hypothetical protein
MILNRALEGEFVLTRYFCVFAGIASLAVLAFPLVQVSAQEQVPPAPAQPPAGGAQAPGVSGPGRAALVSQAGSGKFHGCFSHQGNGDFVSSAELGIR